MSTVPIYSIRSPVPAWQSRSGRGAVLPVARQHGQRQAATWCFPAGSWRAAGVQQDLLPEPRGATSVPLPMLEMATQYPESSTILCCTWQRQCWLRVPNSWCSHHCITSLSCGPGRPCITGSNHSLDLRQQLETCSWHTSLRALLALGAADRLSAFRRRVRSPSPPQQ